MTFSYTANRHEAVNVNVSAAPEVADSHQKPPSGFARSLSDLTIFGLANDKISTGRLRLDAAISL